MKKGFTLVELLVVVGMIALLTGAIGTSVSSARERARIVKAQTEIKELTNAILAYQNYKDVIPTIGGEGSPEDAMESKLGFVLGNGGTDANGVDIPVLYNGTFTGGKLLDPWGHPYKVAVYAGAKYDFNTDSCETGYYLPNANRLGIGEHNQ